MDSQLLMIAIGAWAMALVRVIRESGRYAGAYLYVLVGIGIVLILGASDERPSWAIAGIALTALSVVLPFVLDTVSRSLWEGSKLKAASALAGLRGHLLLGGAPMLQAQIWGALAKLPEQGAGAVAQSLRELKETWDGPGARLMLDEQVFGAYAIDGQWGLALQSVGSMESDPLGCHRVSAALRMRAYLEQGREESALRLLHQAQVAAPQSAFSLRVQWVFLAMTGHPEIGRMAQDPVVQRTLGMSKASGLLWKGIYHRAVDEPSSARSSLEASRDTPTEQRVFHQRLVEVTAKTLDDRKPESWSQELLDARELAYPHFKAMLDKAPRFIPGKGSMLVMAMVFGAFLRVLAIIRDGAGVDALLEWGALTPAVWANGAWWRVLTAPWLNVDLFAWLLVSYLWWVSGFNGPSRFGRLRWVLALLVVPSVCLAVMGGVAPDTAGAGASSVALVSAITTALWCGPQGLALAGRSWAWTVVIGALLLIKLVGAALVPGGGPAAAMTMLMCALLSSLVLGPWAVAKSNGVSWAARVIVGVWVLAWPLIRLDPGTPALIQEEPLQCRAMQVDWELSPRFRPMGPVLGRTSMLPELGGWIDAGSLQGRGRVELGVVERAAGLGPQALSVVAKWPELGERFTVTRPSVALPEALQARLDGDGTTGLWLQGLRVVELRHGGRAVALLVERDLFDSAGQRNRVEADEGVKGEQGSDSASKQKPSAQTGGESALENAKGQGVEAASQVRTVVMLWQPRRPSHSYAPTQLGTLFSASVSKETLPPCPNQWDLDPKLR